MQSDSENVPSTINDISFNIEEELKVQISNLDAPKNANNLDHPATNIAES